MRFSIDQDDRAFLAGLRKSTTPSTIQSLCDRHGVTATAVRQRLMRLQSMGLITRDQAKGDRGRPSYTYRVTEDGLRELGDNYRSLALMLWDEITQIEEVDVRSRLIGRLRDRFAEQYGQGIRGNSLGERITQLNDILQTLGFDVEVAQGGTDADKSGGELLPILRENNCPYHDLASKDASICELEQTVFSQVLGVPLSRTQCCRDGDQFCEFSPERHTAVTAAG